jgi:NAD(P)-dependent dehydrogenase (short-subunit alcohol dehydrogenase family)
MQALTKPNKSVIITGGNSRLGYHCASAIARSGQDWHIIIASRIDELKGGAYAIR